MSDTDSANPPVSWMNEANDRQDAAETEPFLFGTGAIPRDPEAAVAGDAGAAPANEAAALATTSPLAAAAGASSSVATPDYGSVGGGTRSVAGAGAGSGKKGGGFFGNLGDTITISNAPQEGNDQISLVSQHKDPKPSIPERNMCLWFFQVVEGISIVVFLMLLVTQLLPMVLSKKTNLKTLVNDFGYVSLVLRCYISIFCVLFVLTEWDVPIPIIRTSAILRKFASRGFLYSFLGMVCLDEAYSYRVRGSSTKKKKNNRNHKTSSNYDTDSPEYWIDIFMELSAYCAFCLGLFYMLMGVCCLEKLRDSMQQKNRELWKEYREAAKDWKQRNPGAD